MEGTWVLRSTLDMELWEPALIGSTNKANVIVIDKKTKSLVLVDHQQQREYKVMDGDVSHNIYRLALLDDDRIVCGTTDGSLQIYRKHTWELIETIPLHLDSPVIFAVDHISHERRILAVAHGECIINIVSPTSKVVTSSVSVKDKPILDIAVLCHGHIVVRTRCDSDDEIIVLDRKDFAVTSVTHFHDKSLRSIAADQGRDALYVRLFDRTLQKCCIEEMRLNRWETDICRQHHAVFSYGEEVAFDQCRLLCPRTRKARASSRETDQGVHERTLKRKISCELSDIDLEPDDGKDDVYYHDD